MEIDTKATIQEHSKWVAEKVAEAKEIGIRDGSDGLKVSHVIALLFSQVQQLEAKLAAVGERIEQACFAEEKELAIFANELQAIVEGE